MILKMPLSKCFVIKKEELNIATILNNDTFKICTGCVDQYIVTENNQLYGVISSFDIEREMEEKGDFDVDSVIQRNPVAVVQSERFERELTEHIFSKTSRIRSIPIINRLGQMQYVYSRVNVYLQKFVKQNFWHDTVIYQEKIRWNILRLQAAYPTRNMYVLTDFEMYGIDLGEIRKYCIGKERIVSLNPKTDFVLLVYRYDFNCMKVMKQLVEKRIKFVGLNYTGRDIVAEVIPYYQTDEAAKNVLEKEAYYNGNYFDLNDFQNIFQAIRMTENVEGCYVEIGTYRGDSARVALSYMKESGISKTAYFIDTYEGFNYKEAEESGDCDWANTHDDTSIDFVDRRLKEFSNYQLVRMNVITNDLPEEIGDIAVCNIDVDMYEAVEAALEKVYRKILPGGVVLAEDFGHTPALYGAQYAVCNFLSTHKNEFYGMYLQSGQYIMIKK